MLILTLRTLVVYLALILAMRLMGKRQLGELQPSELVSTILLSNLASISIEQPELPLAASLTPVFLIAVLEVLSSGLALHHPKLAQLLSGRPVPVIRNGVIDQNALRALRLTAADLLEALRGKDVFDPADVAYALVETDGTLNLVKQPGKETLLREDVGLSQPREAPTRLPFVLDGRICPDALAWFGKTPEWVTARLQKEKVPLPQVLLLLGDDTDEVTLVRRLPPEEGR